MFLVPREQHKTSWSSGISGTATRKSHHRSGENTNDTYKRQSAELLEARRETSVAYVVRIHPMIGAVDCCSFRSLGVRFEVSTNEGTTPGSLNVSIREHSECEETVGC